MTTLHIHSRKKLVELFSEHLINRINSCFMNDKLAATLALSGGNSPIVFFKHLLGQYQNLALWKRVNFIFTDERFVPPTDLESNFRTMNEHFLKFLTIDPRQTHPMVTEIIDPHVAARDYDNLLRNIIPNTTRHPFPQIDIGILGIGNDGHIASLFPNTTILNNKTDLVAANHVPHLNAWRISLTYPMINRIKHSIVLAIGEQKAEIIRHVFNKSAGTPMLPIDSLAAEGTVDWFIDLEAAKLL